MQVLTAPTRELLEWIAASPRTYAQTMEAWRTHCPRLSVWEDALESGLVRVVGPQVRLTPAGLEALHGAV